MSNDSVLDRNSSSSAGGVIVDEQLAVDDDEDEEEQEIEHHFISINGRQILPTKAAAKGSFECAGGATISVYDTSVLRGDGVFEVMKVIFIKEERGGKKVTEEDEEEVEEKDYNDGYRPKVRCLEYHLERLQTSASQVQCPLPPIDVLRTWIDEAVRPCNISYDKYGKNDGGAALRLMVTKGNSRQNIPPSTILSVFRLPEWPDSFTLCPIEAPWHPAGCWEEWSIPIKWTSYGPNVVSTQKAKYKGYTDALLLSPHRVPMTSVDKTDDIRDCWKTMIPITQWHVLDGPNFAIGFIECVNQTQQLQPNDSFTTEHGDDGGGSSSNITTKAILHFPSNEKLGLLPSITQRIVSKLARTKLPNVKVVRGVYKLETMLDKADEIFVTSTTRGIKCVTSVGHLGNKTFPSLQETKYTKQLVELLETYTGEEEDEKEDENDKEEENDKNNNKNDGSREEDGGCYDDNDDDACGGSKRRNDGTAMRNQQNTKRSKN